MTERDVAQWLERGALPVSLPAMRFRIPLGAGFSERYHVYPPLNIRTLSRWCVLEQGTSPSLAPTWLQVLFAPKKGVQMVHE